MKLLLLMLLAVEAAAQPGSAYDLAHPTRRFDLPAELTEISALTDIDARTVACLEDEHGRIYFIDHTTGTITGYADFAGPGDFEGLTRVGGDVYALRSDGLVFRLHAHDHRVAVADTFRVDVPNRNLESLGYDAKRKVLLIAAKDNLKGGPTVRDQRFIHGWNIAEQRLLARPVLSLSVERVIAQATALGVHLPMERKKNGSPRSTFKLRPSSVAVHPQDDTYWILSAADQALLVFDRHGDLQALHLLDPDLFPKPEGITFLDNGDLLISNEGKGGRANLLFFAKQP